MIKKLLACFLAALMLSGCIQLAACSPKGENKKMVLIAGGKSDYSIVYPENASETVKYAAECLQDYLYQASGVKLKVKRELYADTDEKYISIGKTKRLEQEDLSVDYSSFNGDGFLIRNIAENIYINGATDRGTLYGVYDFLEKFVGVKFLTYDYTYIPSLSELKIYALDEVEIPDFRYRNFMVSGLWNDPAAMSRFRFVNEYITVDPEYGGNIGWFMTKDIPPYHNSLYYVSEEYDAQFPEMFSHDDKGKVVEICQTYGITDDGEIDVNVEISPITLAIESLKKFVLSTDESVEYFMFSQMDTQECCACEKCLRHAQLYGRGGINIRFVNLLAREIQKWADEELNGRKIKVVTFAYQYSEPAPVYVGEDGNYHPIDQTCVPADNVYIRLATIEANNYFSFLDERQYANYRVLFQSWSSIAKNFMVWTYHADFYNYFNYYPTMQTWKENLELYKNIGVEYVLMQSGHYESLGWQTNMEAYIASKVLWNMNADIQSLTEEFMTLYYGIAKDYMMRYKQEYDLYYRTLVERFGDYTLRAGANSSDVKYFSLTFLGSQQKIIDDAIAFVSASSLSGEEKEILTKRLRIARAPILFMRMYNYNGYFIGQTQAYLQYVDEVLGELKDLGFLKYAEYSYLSDYKKNNGIG